MRLLDLLARRPETRVREVDLLDEDERNLVLRTWNSAVAPVPSGTVPELIDEQTARTPEAVAALCDGSELTYRELAARAGQIARGLRARGVTPGDLVGICLPRGTDTIAAILGVWRAGAAYLPLDPEYPAARLTGMLEDCGARCVLGTRATLAAFAESGNGALPAGYALDDEAGDAEPAAAPAVASTLDPSSLAYVLFTSGSTGRPKGVAVARESVSHLVAALGPTPVPEPGARSPGPAVRLVQLRRLGARPRGHPRRDQWRAAEVARLRGEAARQVGAVLGEVSDEQFDAFARVFVNNAETRSAHEFGLFDGDALVVTALQGRHEGDPGPAQWSPYVSGELARVDLDCRHSEMIEPDQLGRIWAAVSDWLAARAAD